MAQRKLYEAEADGNSVIIWQGANGIRVVYPTETAAEIAAEYLINKANEFHIAVEANEGVQSAAMVTVICYGDISMTEFAFVQNYLDRVRKAGLDVQQGLQRESKEFW